jgi:hypothetical protein
MRLIKIFILRLYTDPELQETTCGDLQSLPGRKTFSFKNNVELLNRLHQLANEESGESPMIDSQDENEPNLSGLNQPIE